MARRYGTVAAPHVLAAALLASALPAAAQNLDRDRPGIDHYPAWMREGQSWVAGRDQDYPVFRDRRFDREDPKLIQWRDEQLKKYGPNWRSRPGMQEEFEIWRDSQ